MARDAQFTACATDGAVDDEVASRIRILYDGAGTVRSSIRGDCAIATGKKGGSGSASQQEALQAGGACP